MTIEQARAKLEIEVRDNVHETPNPSKNEGAIAATMQAGDEYALAVLEAMLPPQYSHSPRTGLERRYFRAKARIAALAAPQAAQDGQEPPQQER